MINPKEVYVSVHMRRLNITSCRLVVEHADFEVLGVAFGEEISEVPGPRIDASESQSPWRKYTVHHRVFRGAWITISL